MKTARECIEERRQRMDEYEAIRARLMQIVNAPDDAEGISSRDRVEAAQLIYNIDSGGVPVAYRW